MTAAAPILVLGGSGIFGTRIAELLLRHAGQRVILAARDRARLEAAAARLARAAAGSVVVAPVDGREDAPAAALRHGAAVVVDAAGPFQARDRSLPRACIAASLDYIDIADARDYVVGFGQLDGEAKEAGVRAISGASSVPGLSTAVAIDLARSFGAVRSIEVAISPGSRVPPGRAVVEAILSYAGKPIEMLQGGRWEKVRGWQGLVRQDMPGIGRRWLSWCEVPDLDILPRLFPEARTATFRAGLELGALHLPLWALSGLVRAGGLESLRPLAPVGMALGRLLYRFGTDRGGMTVTLAGEGRDGKPLRRTRTLVAGSGHGPFVPCAPAAILARRLATDRASDPPGASACVARFRLEELTLCLGHLDIETSLSGRLDD